MGIYFQFLDYVKNVSYDEGTLTELHHEPPHHTKKSSDTSPLNVIASLEHHALLHFYRWLEFGDSGDKASWLWRRGQDEEARRAMNEKRIEVCKEAGISFWNSEVQRKLGKRGAIAGHESQKRNKVGRWNSETQREIALKGNTPEVRKKKAEGGSKGGLNSVETRREMGVGVFNPGSRRKGNRMVNLSRWGYIVGGIRLKWDDESRLCLSETFKDYVVEYGFPSK